MKIQSLEITDYPPIKYLKLENLGNIVIIAGANGSGKTRLKQAIVQTLQNNSVMNLTIAATRQREEDYFSGEAIKIEKSTRNQIFQKYVSSRNYGQGEYVGSFVQIDADRDIKTVKYTPINYQINDPDEQSTPNNFYGQPFSTRWQDFVNYIHLKVAAYKNKIADELLDSNLDKTEILEKYPHPLKKYKELFQKTIPDKELQDIDPTKPKSFFYKQKGSSQSLSFDTLSAGEQEVIKVLFDISRKNIKHSIIIFDEPELHLHPALTFRLIEALKTTGERTNQFVFLTHSADLISTYYSTGEVYFIDTTQTGANQAHKLSVLNHNHEGLLKLIGNDLGLFTVGKKIIFVEGENSSIDRMVYHSIAQKYLSEAYVVPVASVENIMAFNSIGREISTSIFGINFYMIRDRDGLSSESIEKIESNGKIKILKKKHIENYFLDSKILLKVADRLCLTAKKSTITKEFIELELAKIAKERLANNLLQNFKDHIKLNYSLKSPTIRNLDKINIDEIKNQLCAFVKSELETLSEGLQIDNIINWLNAEQKKLDDCIESNTWKDMLRGKDIFNMFCSNVFNTDKIQVRQAYVEIALEQGENVFGDIVDFFKSLEN